MNALISVVAVLLFGGSLSAVYFTLVRPAAIFWLRRQAVSILDDLRLAVKKGDIGDHEKAVKPTTEKLNALICGCEHIGITSVVLAMRRNAAIKYEAERDAQTGKDAGSEMKEIIRRADMLLIAAIVLNSPFFWFVLPPLYALGALTGKISRWVNSVSLVGRNGSNQGHHGGLAPA